MSPSGQYENRLFLAFVAFLLWLPLPLGSNRPWAVALMVAGAAMLGLFWLAGARRGTVTAGASFGGARVARGLLVAWLAYILLQQLPLPLGILQAVSPQSAALHALAGSTDWAPLSLDPHGTFLFWLKSVACAAVFGLTLLLVNDKRRLVLLCYALLLGGALQACYGGLMALSGLEYGFFVEKTAYRGFATGTFVNRNHLAGYLEMTLAVGIGLLLAMSPQTGAASSWRQRLRNLLDLALSHKTPLRLMLAMMVIALVLTRSRMGNTAFFASMLIAGGLALAAFHRQCGSLAAMFHRPHTRSAVILLVSLVAIDIAIVGTWFGVEKVAQRIAESSVSSDADRIEVARNTLDLWRDYPVVGSGGGSFRLAYAAYRGEAIEGFYDHAHQDYLEFAAETGAVGLALLAGLVLSSLGAALRALFVRRDALMRGAAFASVMGTLALLIHGTVDFNLQIPANAATFMVILALGWVALHLDRRPSGEGAAERGRDGR